MEIENTLKSIKKAIEEAEVAPNNLIAAIVRLVGIAHANGLDESAAKALAECGIELKIEEEVLDGKE